MADNQKHIKPTADLIRRYHAGELDDRTMHALEKQALDDPLLAEALEGYAMHKPDQSAALSGLRSRLQERLNSGEKNTTAIPPAALPEKGKVRRLDYRWVAAAVILIILTVSGMMLLNEGQKKPEVAQELPKDTASVVHGSQETQAPAALQPQAADSSLPDETPLPDAAADRQIANSALADDKKITLDDEKRAETAKAKKVRENEERLNAKTVAEPAIAQAPPPPPATLSRSSNLNQSAYYTSKPVPEKDRAYGAAPRPASIVPPTPLADAKKEQVHLNDQIDTILIGRVHADTTSYAYRNEVARRKALAQGNKVEGVVTGAESKYRRYAEENDLRILSGRVIDAESGQRLPGVAIRVQGSNRATVTDTAGYFALSVEPNKNLNLDFSYLGYEPTNVIVPGSESHLNIRMPARSDALGETVIVGYGNVRKKSITAATPYYGDTAYRKYLEGIKTVPVKGLKEKITGEVEVTFTVMPNGSMRNFKAHDPFHEEAGKAAVKNVEEGPEWLPASNGKRSSVTLKVPIELVPAK